MQILERLCILIILAAVINLHQIRSTLAGYEARSLETESVFQSSRSTEAYSLTEKVYRPVTSAEQIQGMTGDEYTLNPVFYGRNGTVKSIDGTTVVVSVFASDPYSSWDWNDQEDLNRYSDAYYNLQEAGEWLQSEAAAWGADTVIISDWMEYGELYHEAYFDEDMLGKDSATYCPMSDYVNRYVDSEGIMERFNADSIAYIFYFDGTHTDETWAYAYPVFETVPENIRANEMILLNCGNPSYTMKAATVAHELLHTFGLPDMYCANERITREYVDYLEAVRSDEIMFGHSGWDYYGIVPRFTELDAYYLGLIDDADDLNTWNLGREVYAD